MEVKLSPLISEAEIQKRVGELAQQISAAYTNREPLLVGVLKGAWVFMADLARQLTINANFDFLRVSSYGDSTKTSGDVKFVADLKTPLIDKDVLLIEDIYDTGLTLKYIMDNFKLRQPRSLKLCVFLDKPERHQVAIKIDYLGFTVPNRFIVGYGIDYNERFRNLPYIAYVEQK
jgi:hypoxanthine phosphoribosyltransferase